MSVPTNGVANSGTGVVTGDQLNTYLQTDQTAAQLRAFVGTTGMEVALQGVTAPGDGWAGSFFWNVGSFTDDGYNTIVPPAATGRGAWIRIPDYASVFEVSGTLATVTAVGANMTVNNGTLNATGTLSAGVQTIVANMGIAGGTILHSGTVSLAQIPGSTVLGVSDTLTATPTALAVGNGLIATGGTISFAPIPSQSLIGNGGTSGPTTSIPIGAGLTILGGTLMPLWQLGTVNALDPSLSIAGGTLAASWQGGSVAAVSGGVRVSSGTLSLSTIAATTLLGNAGTVAALPAGVAVGANLTLTPGGTLNASPGLSTIAATTLLGNAATVSAVPAAIAVGANLTLTPGGTLNATAVVGTTTTVVAGAGLSGGTISTTGTLAVVVGSGLALTGGTVNLASIAAATLLGNSATIGAVPTGVAVGAALSLNSGTINLASIAAATLLGNGGTVNAVPSAITLGAGLSVVAGTLTVTGGQWNAGSVTALTGGLSIAGTTLGTAKTVGAVGTTLLAQCRTAATPVTGTSYAGSLLYNIATGLSYGASGTWLCLSPVTPYSGCCCTSNYGTALFLRTA